jgi:hypothetical protein
MAGLANSSGGRLVLPDGCAEVDILELAQQIDPPLTGLISVTPGESPSTRFVNVRQSPHCPHIDAQTGTIFTVNGAGDVIAVSSRLLLDGLYSKGGAALARAQRSTDGMVERVQLASFGHYGIAIIACLLTPSAELYSWAVEHSDEFSSKADQFTAEWKFVPAAVHVQSGVLEVRGPGDVTGVIRITRAGCVLVGEMRRKLPGDQIGTMSEQRQRLTDILTTVWRITSRADQPRVMTRFVCEGLRGTSLSPSDSASYPLAKADSLDMLGPEGDSSDLTFQTEALDGFTRELLENYAVAPQTA